ncbi:MAG: globin [Candidatus Thermofonsia Clade 1 bacterium]|jgi:hemoglobin|uniref:Globin n=1 Tax=Candidatus Thermofonsia Clade 1 bacterium TaxID=2364210 RepID=A0A2M8PH00_9CHLR|nr:MAG: globin [Candidatus Thermofonsia Clade 1 bacterium]
MSEARHSTKSVYEQVGEAALARLIAAFYRRVKDDPILRPLYPEQDLAGAERRLRLFVIQYFGGPTDYSAERGHPRLRMRHAPYAIGQAERDAWLAAMLAALDEAQISEPAYSQMRQYFEQAATFMINRPLSGALHERS